MYFYEDEVAAVVDALGMRGVLANAHFDVTDATNSDRTLAEGPGSSLRAGCGHSRIVPALGPARALHRGAWALPSPPARARGRSTLLVVTHLARDSGRRSRHPPPLRSLADPPPWRTSVSWTAGWSPPTVLWIDGEEIDLLAAARAGVVRNPRSNH